MLRTISQEELRLILDLHGKWLRGEPGGVRANLRWANLSRANLSGADLRRADLSRADLRKADLSEANLSEANLSEANLRWANLSGANLSEANLSRANLSGANLSEANLSRANLSGADLRRADLSGAKLSGADLRWTNLSRAELSGANLSEAELSGADLSGAQGLPSAIDYLEKHFVKTKDGYIVYKTFGANYPPPEEWGLQAGSTIRENVNPNRTEDCGCGVNVATLEWVKGHYSGTIWKCLIEWEWLPGVVVPYNTDGKIRCERVRLLEEVA